MRESPLVALFLNVLTWLLLGAISFPLFWMFSTALRPETELFQRPPALLPSTPTLEHFLRLLQDTPFPTYMLNSAMVAFATTITVIAVGLMGAYGISRFRFRGRKLLLRTILLTYLLPSVVLFIPIYMMLARLGLINSMLGLVLAYTTFALPFALWLLRGFIDAIPLDLEHAALVDGANRIECFFDVVLPQALPGIISTSLFTFILAWNEYLYALVLISRDSYKTLPPGVMTMLTSAFQIEWSLLMAASVLMSLPLIISFAFLQRHLTSGFGAGALKG